jgi:hypothetical protein
MGSVVDFTELHSTSIFKVEMSIMSVHVIKICCPADSRERLWVDAHSGPTGTLEFKRSTTETSSKQPAFKWSKRPLCSNELPLLKSSGTTPPLSPWESIGKR